MKRIVRTIAFIFLLVAVTLGLNPQPYKDVSSQGDESNSALSNDTSVEAEWSAENEFEHVPESVKLDEPSKEEESFQNQGDADSFWIDFFDVGQGDSALVQCNGHYLLIDGGPSSASSKLYTILKNREIDYLDYIIATHPDSDHIGGLSGALNYASVGVCFSPVSEGDSKQFSSLVKYLDKQNVSITTPMVGDVYKLGNAEIIILGPIENTADTNNNSIVVKVVFGSNAFLFMGDAEFEEENTLIASGEDLRCDVIKIAHHGSKGSTSSRFLETASPKTAVISVGSDNSYGHPTEDTLDRLLLANVDLFRTDIQGDIRCSCDGEKISFVTEKDASELVLWIPGPSAKTTVTRNGIVVEAPDDIEIPEGTTYVINANSGKFHLPSCGSVASMSEKNRVFSTESAEALVAAGYKPCGRCNPTDNNGSEKGSQDDAQERATETKLNESRSSESESVYVLNTHSMKFHKPDCSSVTEMDPKNRKDVTGTREELIKEGYSPCKRCNP